MPAYTSITIVFNPNSTGPGKEMATDFARKLRSKYPDVSVSLKGTKYSGHGESIAYAAAKNGKRPLIVSVSGDGGYNDVVNGLMKAKEEGAQPVAGLLPAGNANDHYRNLYDESFDPVRSIAQGRTREIDLLKFASRSKGKAITRYAHSYIGLGLSSKAGHELNKTKLNRLNETWIVIKAMVELSPTKLIVDGRRHRYDSLVFSNVGKMSKVMNLSDASEIDDDKFEVVAMYRRTRIEFIVSLVRASTVGLDVREQKHTFEFQPVKRCSVQLDGEIIWIDKEAESRVDVAHRTLECLS